MKRIVAWLLQLVIDTAVENRRQQLAVVVERDRARKGGRR